MNPIARRLLPITLTLLLVTACTAQETPLDIRLNQVGFYPGAPKLAVVVGASDLNRFEVVDQASGSVVKTGTLSEALTWEHSGEQVRLANFSEIEKPGTYVVRVGQVTGAPFQIGNRVHDAVVKASIKGYYFQRTAMPLTEAFAGKWAREAGHPDNRVLVHPSAASADRPAGTVISSPRGWYDAGDYNKYIVNSSITVWSMLALFEHYVPYATALEVDIPEKGGPVPDLLDETLWNLRWMLTMQDPADGGVYHKLTNAAFDDLNATPASATKPRYVVQKSTTAALDFAAVTAQAARIFAAIPALEPLSDSCRTASLRAWEWARRNPAVMYNQMMINRQFDPDVTTGAYGDRSVSDEFKWAASELFITTRADSFLTIADVDHLELSVPEWAEVGTLGVYSLLMNPDAMPEAQASGLKDRFLAFAARLRDNSRTSAYRVVMGMDRRDFVWGSNAVAANQGIALMIAYRLSGDRSYAEAALSNLDYLLGRNATGHSFLTGAGSRQAMHPHHRPSVADEVAEPVPGLLVGGPNPGKQDAGDCPVTYPFSEAGRAWIDHECSYASNEIAINWNAPFVYLSGAVEAVFGR